jgi:hypothetical protein
MKLDSIEKIENEINKVVLTDKEIALNQLYNIIDKLPNEISDLIESAFINNRIPKEYLLSSILFAFSNAAGLAFSLNALGYENYANFYFAIIGNRGDVKSASMKIATDVLRKYDDDSFENENINQLENIKIKKFLCQNSTIQAIQYSHFYNKYSIGIFIDELSILISKMANNSNSDGMEWRTSLLEGYNNSHIDVLRRSTESFRINKSYLTLMGSIQEQFVPKLFANGNLESGLIDRILFTTKLTSNSKINRFKIPDEITTNYNTSLTNVIEHRREIEENQNIESIELILEIEAELLLEKYVQELLNNQDIAQENIKEYLSKLQISIHKLIILVHLIKNAKHVDFSKKISIEEVKLAIEINEFYYTNFKIVNSKNKDKNSKPLDIDKVVETAIKNGAMQKDVVSITGVSKSTISRKWKEKLNNMKLETKEQNSPNSLK